MKALCIMGTVVYLPMAESIAVSRQSHLLGAIIGDIVGSRFERARTKNPNPYNFEAIPNNGGCTFTDDSVLTIAVAHALIHNKPYDETIRFWARKYPSAGYGASFNKWMRDDSLGPYNSWGNGSAMRVSPCGYLPTLERVLEEAKSSAECTHDHPEGIKGAQATAACVYMARHGGTKEEIRSYVTSTFGYDLDRTIESIRPTYTFDVSCQGSVPESLIAFFDGKDYEDTIRLAVSLGGDTDTQAAIAGSIAQAFYKEIPLELETRARNLLTKRMLVVVDEFNSHFD